MYLSTDERQFINLYVTPHIHVRTDKFSFYVRRHFQRQVTSTLKKNHKTSEILNWEPASQLSFEFSQIKKTYMIDVYCQTTYE